MRRKAFNKEATLNFMDGKRSMGSTWGAVANALNYKNMYTSWATPWSGATTRLFYNKNQYLLSQPSVGIASDTQSVSPQQAATIMSTPYCQVSFINDLLASSQSTDFKKYALNLAIR